MSSHSPNPSPRSPGLLAYVLGVVLVAGMVPLIQWVDEGSRVNGLEATAPPAGAVGLLAGLILANALFLGIARLFGAKGEGRGLSRQSLALIYIMLTLAVPLCNMGLVRPFYSAISAAMDEVVNRAVATVEVHYNSAPDGVYPKLPLPPSDVSMAERTERLRPLKQFFEGDGRADIGIKALKRKMDDINRTLWEDRAKLTPAERDALVAQRADLNRQWWKLYFTQVPWNLWAAPLANWFVFMILIFALLTCLAELLRQRWLEHENLALPLAGVPQAMLDNRVPGNADGPRLWTDPLFLLAVVVTMAYLALPALKHYKIWDHSFPAYIDLGPALTEKPWDAIKANFIVFSPILLGIGYLLSLEISRSIWVIYGLAMLVQVVGGHMALDQRLKGVVPNDRQGIVRFPFWEDQAAGALMIWGLLLLWQSRKAILGRASGENPAPRWMGLLTLVVLVATVAWSYRLGISDVRLALLLIVVLVLWSVAWARMRAEAGLPYQQLLPTLHRYNMFTGGLTTYDKQASMMANDHSWTVNSFLPGVLPAQLEALKLAKLVNLRKRSVYVGTALAFVIAVGLGLVLLLYWHYNFGGQGPLNDPVNYAANKFPVWTYYNSVGSNLDQGKWDVNRLVATGVGGVVMAVLLALRAFFFSFPLHPIGYVLVGVGYQDPSFYNNVTGGDTQPNILWAPMFMAWLAKSTVIRSGGMDLYKRSQAIAYGLIIGHLLSIVLWNVFWAVAWSTGSSGPVALKSKLDLIQGVFFPP